MNNESIDSVDSVVEFKHWVKDTYPILYPLIQDKGFFGFCNSIGVGKSINENKSKYKSDSIVANAKLYVEDNEFLHSFWML